MDERASKVLPVTDGEVRLLEHCHEYTIELSDEGRKGLERIVLAERESPLPGDLGVHGPAMSVLSTSLLVSLPI